MLRAIRRSIPFALWSLRRRASQAISVALAFLILTCAVQMVSALHDVSSTLAQQRIARSWRMPYDLFVRPQAAVSRPEQAAGWIAPQSMLENYAGISQQQVELLRGLPHVEQVIPYASLGWQNIDITIPISLTQQGIYRISASWSTQDKQTSDVIRYVEVSDLAALTHEQASAGLGVQDQRLEKLIAPASYPMSLQGIQEVIGVQAQDQGMVGRWLFQGDAIFPAARLTVHVERLDSDVRRLAFCVKRSACWQSVWVPQGAVQYRPDGVQLYRYTETDYVATSQQIAAGQVTIVAGGRDMTGPLYRLPMARQVALPATPEFSELQGSGPEASSTVAAVVPFGAPERSALLPAAVRFVPLEPACAMNGANCYSGVYLQLNGVERYSQSSLALLQATAATITARTGLHVDILDGSSVRTVTVVVDGAVPVGVSWRVTGVAVQIVHGIDLLQETLLVLCSVVCLLAIGVAGVVIGIGRRNEAELLRETGWPLYLQICTFALDALILCLPGYLLSAGWIGVTGRFWSGSLPGAVLWLLLGGGTVVYCCLLVSGACVSSTGQSKAFHLKVTVPLVAGLATTAAVFLISSEYLLVSNLNRVLVITLLGHQVRETLEGAQIALFLLILAAAMLTVGLCMKLVLLGRRSELALLAMLGWEWRFVLGRVLWDSGRPALLCGEIGVGVALLGTALAEPPPALPLGLGMLLGGPIIGMVLVSAVTIVPAWQEIKRAFRWK